ncbi:KptA family-domain-containing protein, partial [Mycena galopus ATCC 62051]
SLAPPLNLCASQYCSRRFLKTAPHSGNFELFTKRLHWLLRHGAVPPVMTMRPDGYVRLDDVRNLSLFRKFSLEFDQLIAHDESRWFKVIQEYDPRIGADASWIRARTGHSIQSVDTSVKRILSPETVPTLVYSVDLATWRHTQHHGIQSQSPDGLIHMLPTTAVNHFDDAGHVFIFLDTAKMLGAGIPLWRSTRGGVAWLTTGDPNGILPPQLFYEAIKVSVDRQTILSVPSPSPQNVEREAEKVVLLTASTKNAEQDVTEDFEMVLG